MNHTFVVVLWVCSAFGQQSIAVYSPFIGQGPAAPGSILSVNFVPANPDLDLSHYTVKVNGNPARVLSFDSVGIRFVLSLETPLGTASVEAMVNGIAVGSTQIDVVHSAPALIGPEQNWGSGVNRLTNPAQAGDYIVLWATGLGDLTEADVMVDLAGKMITPSFAGHAPGQPGVDQINFQVPADAQRGCYIPVSLQAADVISNGDVVAVSDSLGSCPHPLGLSVDQLKTLDEGKTIEAGIISVTSDAVGPSFGFFGRPPGQGYSRFEQASGTFGPLDATRIASLSGFLVPDLCELILAQVVEAPSMSISYAPPPRLLPGSLTLAGPAGQQLTATALEGGSNGISSVFYSGSPPPPVLVGSLDNLPDPFFVAGAWNVAASGDPIVSPFRLGFQLPPPVRWTNWDSLSTISRDSDVTITWDPSGYQASDIMSIVLSPLSINRSTGMRCTVAAENGNVVLPQSLLQRVSPNTNGGLSLIVSPRAGQLATFQVPFADGSSGPGWVSYSVGVTASVVIQ